MRMLVLAALALSASPATAAVVFSDTFDSENGGASALNYSGFANWTISNGTVDLIANGNFGISCDGGAGSCVDLDGSTANAGEMLNSSAIAFDAGDHVLVTYRYSGNQRSGADDLEVTLDFGVSTMIDNASINGGAGSGPGALTELFSPFIGIQAADPFATGSFSFDALEAGSFTLLFEALSNDNIGPILDSVSVDVNGEIPVPEPGALGLLGIGALALAFARRR
jgi:hypothetical protein